MKVYLEEILEKEHLEYEDVLFLLSADTEEAKSIFRKASNIKAKHVGKKTFFRGLVEFSNYCAKNCLYCGIRRQNNNIKRYSLSNEEIIESIKFGLDNGYLSFVIQSGELQSEAFIKRVNGLLEKISSLSNEKLGITLSLGEYDEKVYKTWFDLGARRYLLRIETSNPKLFDKIHPNDGRHVFEQRVAALGHLKNIGYQVGTGIMIGLPFQTIEDLAHDLMFFREHDIDMCGMGPYLEHKDTPLYQYKEMLLTKEKRFELSLRMIAILRIMMPNINIAASTAMQAINAFGREKALIAGANIIMPNLTPARYRNEYKLYDDKPCTEEERESCIGCLEMRVNLTGDTPVLGEFGDSPHYFERLRKN